MKRWLLKLHRWLALLFALPLLAVLGSGLVLSVEPIWTVGSIRAGTIDAARLERLIAEHDPAGRARSLSIRAYDRTLTLAARGERIAIVDLATGAAAPGPSGGARFLQAARTLHETLLLDAGGVVVASTVAMLVLAVLGIAMGWPRLARSVAGWHAAFAWLPLPLVVLSPLTGLLLAAGITLAPAPGADGGGPPPPGLVDAVRAVGASHDLSGLVWIRTARGRTIARIVEDGEYRVYVVRADGVAPASRNWPRLWHEGNFAVPWSAGLNVVASVAMLGLLATGPWLWLQRRMRRARARAGARTAA